MYKSIFVPLQGLSRDAEALNAAYRVASLYGAHLDCLHVRPDPRLLVASTTAGMETGLGVGVFPAELWNALVEADQQRARAARVHFEKFCKNLGVSKVAADSKGVTASFHEVEGDAARDMTKNARYSDLVVLGHDSLASEVSWDAKGDVIIGCGRPVLLAPTKTELFALSNVAIAWKDTAEAARAVTAAMPLLAKAGDIVVLAAREGPAKVEDALRSAERVAAFLRRHSFPARAEHVPAENKGVPDAVIDRAIELKSDILVMGAYGHGRMREFVFGGFTRHVLA